MSERIAVIGMAFRFPGAETSEEYWRIIQHGSTRIRRFTDAELAAAGVPAERYRRPDFVGAGAALDDIAGFDAQFFRVSAREALITDPQQRIFLECAYHALENAGYPQESARNRIGVYASTGYHLYAMQTYLLNNALQDTEADNWLSRMETMVGNHSDFTATRAAFRLGLTGPAVNVQTACSSSLVAVQLAARSVLAGDCDIALVGATALHVPKVLGYYYVKGSILSKSGQLRPFDAAADGTVGGMGVAAIVLKNLERAVADGDTVHGVIRGSGVTNDGAAKTTFTASSVPGQHAAIRRALTAAGTGADSIGYVEMHGTGTLKGDPIEFEATTSAFRQDTSRIAYCGIGSVKGNIGHLDACAGIAGLIKVLLVLKHGVIPPLAGFNRANPALDMANSPFYIPERATPWPRTSAPRMAGLTSLGVGGTNVHLVVEEAPARMPRPSRVPPPGLVLVSGRNDASLRANVQALSDHLRDNPNTGMADLVTTTLSGRVHFPRRMAVQGQTPAVIADALGSWLDEGRADESAVGQATTRPVAFIFSGQGGTYQGMAAALHERFTRVRATLRDFERQYTDSYGESLLDWLTADGPAGTPPDTATEQPALFALQHAITMLWRDAGVVPGVAAGHSVGEYAALCAAGAISAQDGLRLTAERGRLMRRRCPPGAMVAVSSDRQTAERLAAQVAGVELAVVNGPERHVLAGPPAAIERLCAILTDRNISGKRLPVGHAFHTIAMEALLPEYRALLRDVAIKPITTPFISGLDGRLRPAGWTPDPDYFLRHIREPVRFDKVLRALSDGDFAALLEIGPNATLGSLARTVMPDAPVLATSRRGSGPDPMWAAAAGLHCAGADIDWQVLLEGCVGGRIPLPGYRFQHKAYWTGPEPVKEAEMKQVTTPVDRILQQVTELTARRLRYEPQEVTADGSFFDLGADSLQMIDILRELEQDHQVKVAMRELFDEANTPRLLAELIARRLNGAGEVDLAALTTVDMPEPEPEPEPAREHGPRVTVSRSSGMVGELATDSQQAHVRDLTERYTARTRTSRQLTQRHRKVLADSRAVVGFRSSTKEMLYPIAARRARGSWLEDVDGNRYVDITMGFGALLFGHEPDFVSDAIKAHLSEGLRLGPRPAETGEAAELLAALTGMQRVAFAVSGTEANSAAIRLARAATGRSKMVIFNGAYHGHADNVLGRSAGPGAERRAVPVSTGIPASAVADLLVLDYGEPASMEVIEEFADEIAVVVVEPVQSRNPSLRPVEFVRKLRDVTRDHGIVLMFDEMLTGLRFAPGGAQEFYGVRADLATYGKALGGGFPIGAIAGRSDIMDGVDGGFWQYGDDSYPHADTTFFGGTYIQHPVAMTAAKAVLTHLTEHGPELQRRLNARTNELASALNRFFEAEDFPLRMHNFGSMFRFEHRADMDLLYNHLMLRGVHIWEWRNFFLSTAHSGDDIEIITDAVRESLLELRGAGFFPADHAPRISTRAAGRLPAMPLNTTAVASQPRRVPDFSIYFFGDYPQDETPRDGKYELIADVARFADEHGFHALWMPERHFHSFGGLFPNPAVLASALARETRRIRLNAGSVVLPLHDPIRVAEEWSMVDNLSGGRIGIGCAGGWHANDFVFFPDRFGQHKELMYEQVEVVRSLWRGEKIRRRTGDGEREVRLFPRPVQEIPPMFTAVVGNPASYEAAARHDMGVVTNLMSQSVEQLAENIARYRRARAAHGLDPDAGRVAVLLHTYLAADHDSARREAYDPMRRYMKASMSLFGSFTNSLGYNVDMASLDEDDLDVLFRRAYERYCDQRALIGAVETATSVVDAVSAAGADEIVSLVDFGVAPDALRSGLTHLGQLRRATCEPDRAEPSADTAPLSAAQWRLWFLERMSTDVRACNELKAVRLDGPLDVPALHTALRRLVQRHEQLRTVVRQIRGEPRQFLLPHAEPDFAVVDRPAAVGADEDAVVREVVAAEGSRRFDLENGPLFVTRLVRVGKDRHVLVMCLHHIVVDALSLAIMTRDLSALYQAECDHAAADLPVTDRSYYELSQAPQDERETARCLEYWRQVLGGDLPVLEIPCDRPRPAELTFGGGNVFHTLDAELSDELRALSRTHHCTAFMTLLAGYAAMLHHVTGQDDIIIGTPVSHRPPGAENMVGLFLNPIALRVDLSGDPGFGMLITRIRRAVADGCDHLAVPFETVVRELAPRRVGNRTPIFQTYAEYESGEPFLFDLPGVRATVLEQAPDRALTDLTMYFIDQPAGIRAHLQYNVDLFDAATAERFLDRFRRILLRAVHEPDAPLSDLAALDKGAVPLAWERGPSTSIEEITVHEMIARRAQEAPGRPAVVYGETTLTYGELDERAGRFAAAIIGRFGEPSPDGLIALWLPPSPELILAMVGVLKAGYGFLPLDPGIGEARAQAVLADCGALAVVRAASAAELRQPPDMAVCDVADLLSAPVNPMEGSGGNPGSLCYVIYTSGSTGKPKGVAISHRSLVNMCQWQHRWFAFTAADRSALLCSHGFDASVLEIWPALTAGASLAIPDHEVRLDPRELAGWYAATGVTYSLLPTALGEAVMAIEPPQQPPLRHLATGGDALRTRPHADAPYQVTNIYGPTEATVVCATAIVEPEARAGGAAIALGRPLDNVRLCVLDESGQRAAVGSIGELYIGGAGVGQGYWRMPDQTAKRFVPDPRNAAAGRMYRSGDLVRWTENGELEFCGRTDDQVKIRGFRVEPEEVTRALGRLDGVRDAVVLSRRNSHGEAYLAAFVVPSADVTHAEPDVLAERFTAALADRLPEFLVPRAWEILAALPVNVNGKVDRVALPETSIVTTLPQQATRTGTGPVPLVDRLRLLWAAEFAIDPGRIGLDTSFFDLGGHSIAMIRLANGVLEEFGIDFPLPRFYQQPTVRAMAAYLSEMGPAPRTPETADCRVTGRL